MVSHKGKCSLVVILVGWMYCGAVAAAGTFTVETSTEQVELGKAFLIELRSGVSSASLSTVDLGALQQDFHVREKGDVRYEATGNQQSLSLKLYARRTGALTIPSLQFGGFSSLPVPIQVSAATDPKTGQSFEVYFEYDDAALWVKQQWLLKAVFITDQQIVHLDTGQATLQNFDQQVLSPRQHQHDSAGKYRHETGWVLFPAKAGSFVLELPAVKYYRDGVNTHNFYPPRLQVNVRPLPVYIPGNVPVGRLSLQLDGPASPFLIAGQLNHYRLKLVGEGIQSVDMPVITLQSRVPEQALHYQSIKEEQVGTETGGISSVMAYRFPFVTTQTGRVSFSPLRLQYFDPLSGRLHSETIEPGSWWSFPLWLVILWLLLMAVTAFYVIRKLAGWLAGKWNYFKTCRFVVHTITTSLDCNDYRTALQLLTGAEGWQHNSSLQQIKRNWAENIPGVAAELQGIDLLMRSLYRGERIEVELIRQQLLALLYSRRRWFRYF